MAQRIIGLSQKKIFLLNQATAGGCGKGHAPSFRYMSRALISAAATKGKYYKQAEEEEIIQVDLEQKVASRDGSLSSASSLAGGPDLPPRGKIWWGPHPSTGVYVPEGKDLHTSSPSDGEDLRHLHHQPSAWFRDDVHHSTMHA